MIAIGKQQQMCKNGDNNYTEGKYIGCLPGASVGLAKSKKRVYDFCSVCFHCPHVATYLGL